MEIRKLLTFICHDSALLYAISVLILKFFNSLLNMFPTLRDLSFLINLWNLLYRNRWKAHFIPLVSQFRPESYYFLSKRLPLSLKKYILTFLWLTWLSLHRSSRSVWEKSSVSTVTVFKATSIYHDASIRPYKLNSISNSNTKLLEWS